MILVTAFLRYKVPKLEILEKFSTLTPHWFYSQSESVNFTLLQPFIILHGMEVLLCKIIYLVL